jgi:hypothetical protein
MCFFFMYFSLIYYILDLLSNCASLIKEPAIDLLKLFKLFKKLFFNMLRVCLFFYLKNDFENFLIISKINFNKIIKI